MAEYRFEYEGEVFLSTNEGYGTVDIGEDDLGIALYKLIGAKSGDDGYWYDPRTLRARIVIEIFDDDVQPPPPPPDPVADFDAPPPPDPVADFDAPEPPTDG